MTFATADISDELHPNVQYVEPIFKTFGNKIKFHGKIKTIKCFEDNSLVKQALFTDGNNQVLVVDAGGSIRCAMLGDMLAAAAVKNNWAGIIMHGLIRDSVIVNTLDIGVRALGTLPLKSEKQGIGQEDKEVRFAGVTFTPGNYLYADEDGIIVLKEKHV
jgi:regulator of ribonuclease activity A